MPEKSSIGIYSVLDEGSDEGRSLLETAAGVFDPPRAGETTQYEYRVFDEEGDHFASGSTADFEELKRIFGDWHGGIVGGNQQLRWGFGDLRFQLVFNHPPIEYPVPPSVSLQILWEHFRPESMFHNRSPREIVMQALELAEIVHELYDSEYTYGVSLSEPGVSAAGPDRADLRSGEISLHWLDILPERIVDSVGRDRVHASSAWEVRDLDDGDVMIVCFENPVDEGLLRIEAVERELGLLG